MFLMMSVLGATGLAAAMALIPILVHLLHRQKVTPIAWGAMQFLLETPLKVRRRRRIDNWLLMLVRITTLRKLKPNLSKGDIPKAVAAARDLLVHGYNTRKLILIVSDNQRTNWEPNAEQIWRQAEGKPLGPIDDLATSQIPVFNIPVTG